MVHIGPSLENLLSQNCKVLYDYLHLDLPLTPADVLIVLGNNDDRTATYAAQLYSQSYAPQMCITGGVGSRSKDRHIPEAIRYQQIILPHLKGKLSQPLLETQATNTGQNISFSQALLQKSGIFPNSTLIVTKPYSQRRALASFQWQWQPSIHHSITALPLSFEGYFFSPLEKASIATIADNLHGEGVRLWNYQGTHIAPQHIPLDIIEAIDNLDQLLDEYAQLTGYQRINLERRNKSLTTFSDS